APSSSAAPSSSSASSENQLLTPENPESIDLSYNSEAPAESESVPSSSEESFVDETTATDDSYTPSDDVLDETLKVTVNGKKVSMDAYTLISQVVENETRGSMHPEAIKAQSVAAYTFIKYNNQKGIFPSVLTRSNVSKNVSNAVNAVLGKTIRYNGSLINSTYHSTSRGQTTSSKSVWGNALPYLVPVDSPYDKLSPYYKNTFVISDSDFVDNVYDTYGIDLYKSEINPADWIYIDETKFAPGGYVGAVEIGGYSKSRGGTVDAGTPITGRNIREQLLGFSLKSTSFDVKYSNGNFVFTTY
ncbi:MAG: SpoIID/LytB domain-containing protein, partial [Acinetobacter sp.]